MDKSILINRFKIGSVESIFIIRHAEPLLTTNVIYEQFPGPTLSNVGLEQIKELLADTNFKYAPIEIIYTSPFVRALSTAKPIADCKKKDLIIEPLLQEFDTKTENIDLLKSRINDFLNIVKQNNYKHIAIISHGSPIKELLLQLGFPFEQMKNYKTIYGNPIPPCGIWHFKKTDGNLSNWIFQIMFVPKVGLWDKFKS